MAYTMKDLLRRGIQPTFGYLLPVVRSKGTIFYGEIANRLAADLAINGKVFPTQVGAVVGTLMYRLLEMDPSTPLINVLVVSQKADEPSSGADTFLRLRFRLPDGEIPDELRRNLVAQAANEVYAFRDWPHYFERLFSAQPPSESPLTLIQGTEADGTPTLGLQTSQHYGGPAESDQHKRLKAYVLANPAAVGANAKPDSSEAELVLLSGDEVDVYFARGNHIHLVEVKSILSSDPDLRRGVYQCVKYRAVYQAQCKGVTPDIKIVAILVVERKPPPFIEALASLHHIRIVVIEVNV